MQGSTAKAFGKQVTEHELLIYKVCRMYAYTAADRQDLFQEIVIQLWKSYSSYRAEAKFSTWLYRIAINTAITGLRKQKNIITSYEPAALPQQIADTDSKQAEEQLQQMYTAIDQLNQVEKAIVMLYMEDKSYEEMEDILGMTQGSLRTKMSRIKDKLRSLTKSN